MSLALVGKAAGNSARGTRGDSLPYPNPADKGFGFLGFASISLARTCEDLTNFSRKVAGNIKKYFRINHVIRKNLSGIVIILVMTNSYPEVNQGSLDLQVKRTIEV